jgi:hypothetical protein
LTRLPRSRRGPLLGRFRVLVELHLAPFGTPTGRCADKPLQGGNAVSL